MPRLTPKLIIALLSLALGLLAAALWLVPRLRKAQPVQSVICEGWQQTEAANQSPLGWDLTYMSLLKKIGLCPGYPICEEWAKPAPPIQKYVAQWQGDPIVSSFEIELPDGHADMSSMWFIRTKDQAYYRVFYPLHEDNAEDKYPLPAQEYDRAFEAMACWQQTKPPTTTFGEEGYIGFMSLYKEGKSRQMLLAYEDLYVKDKDSDKEKPGRLPLVMKPLVTVMEQQQKQSAPSK
jgi:hypothetical protein